MANGPQRTRAPLLANGGPDVAAARFSAHLTHSCCLQVKCSISTASLQVTYSKSPLSTGKVQRDTSAPQDQPQTSPTNQPQDATSRRPQSHAHTNLLSALRDQKRDHPVQPNHRQHEPGHRKEADEKCLKTRPIRQLGHPLPHR